MMFDDVLTHGNGMVDDSGGGELWVMTRLLAISKRQWSFGVILASISTNQKHRLAYRNLKFLNRLFQ